MKSAAAAIAAPILFAMPAFAQTASTPMAPPAAPAPAVAVIQPAQSGSVLRTGTAVALKTREALTTKGKKLKPGTRVQLEVAEPVMLNGMVVIPVGTPAVGEVTDVRNKGMWGKSGRINARVLYATVNGRQVRLTGAFDDKGTTGTGGVVASAVFIPVAGFFVTGTSANIPIGAPVGGFLDEDVPVAMSNVEPAPLYAVAPAPAPASVSVATPQPMTASTPVR